MKPRIGIIVCGFTKNHQFVTNDYIQSIRYSSGIPFIIPIVRSDRMIKEYLSFCDGFLFCGGEDITPLLFGQEPLNGNGKSDITVDLFQLRFMKQILLSGKPVLGICRGMQILNVACGGTVWQDLSLIPGKILDHMQQTSSRSEVSHRIKVKRNSFLYCITGSSSYVNSYHHQAIHASGEGIVISAKSSDHVPEAIELLSHPFAVGVQWHPECMYRESESMRNLFRAFIQKGRNRN